MPLKGYTTDAVPGRIFSPDELLELLASPDNPTDWTYAMGRASVFGVRNEKALSVTTLTSTCPREFKFKQTFDYTLRLEAGQKALEGTLFHAMMEHSPVPPGQKVIRERYFAKRVEVDGQKILLPGRMDEIVLDYKGNGTGALLRDYKTTTMIPKWSPWPGHGKQLNLYAWLLSDVPEPPLALPPGVDFWHAGAEEQWEPVDPIVIRRAEIVYYDKETAKRVGIGEGCRYPLQVPSLTYAMVKALLPRYLGSGMVPYIEATSKAGFGFHWKCEKFCPVRDACLRHWITTEANPNPDVALKQLEQAGWELPHPPGAVLPDYVEPF